MPHLRFNRDRRGYETTSLVHNARRRGKGQSRILYWFRTPPGVRVGRSAIDEEAIRLLEEHNPDVQFDWTHILKAGPPPQAAPAPSDARDLGPGRPLRRRERRGPIEERRAVPRVSEPPPVHRSEPPKVEPRAEEIHGRDAVEDAEPAVAPRSMPRDADAPAQDRLPPSRAEQIEAELDVDSEEEEDGDLAPAVELGTDDHTSAAYQRLGSEGLGRLRARYAEVMARIAERPMDDQAREELKLRAERLNPDGWVTADEVREALEQYESVFEGVRALVGTRRRRRRRKKGASA